MPNQNLATEALKQLDTIIEQYHALIENSVTSERLAYEPYVNVITRSLAAIERIAGRKSQYFIQAEKLVEMKIVSKAHGLAALIKLGGVIKALRSDVQVGYLASMQELIHSTLFSDFLEMAEHLLSEEYKDPAAVIVGSVLEEHLRKLCDKHSIATETPNSHGTMRPKTADTLNNDLASTNVYNKLDQKSVTAWLDLRNKAAHGKYAEYNADQVALLLQSVRDFIIRHPA